jgi:hypothetical protein
MGPTRFSPQSVTISLCRRNTIALTCVLAATLYAAAAPAAAQSLQADFKVYKLVEGAAGDLNCDGSVDYSDINPFTQVLSNPAAYGLAYPDCDARRADVNGDGTINYADINSFVALLSGARRGTEWQEVDLATESVECGLRVRLDGAASSGGAASFFWDFGDAAYGSNPAELHGFSQDRTITLNVYNADWTEWSTATKTIHVTPAMQFLDTGPAVAQNAMDLAVSNSVAWVSHGVGTLSALDVSDPANVTELARVSVPAACGIAVSNGLLYLTGNWAGLRIYQATIPPVPLGTYDTYAVDQQTVVDVAAAGNVAYVSAGPAGFKVLDMSTPASPRLLGRLSLAGGAYAQSLAVRNGVAYLTDSQGRVHLIDVSAIDVWNPQASTPVLLGTLSNMFYAANLAVSERGLLAYVSSDGIKLFDAANPRNAQLASTIAYDTNRPPSGLIFVGDMLYAGSSQALGYDMRVKRINVLDPSAPYTMETLLINSPSAGGSINHPAFNNGAIIWLSGYNDVLTVDIVGH